MANTGFKGINVKQTGAEIVEAFLFQDSSGALLTTGSPTYYVDELQSDATFKSLDFTGFAFKTTALTTPTAPLAHQARNNGSTNTGTWTLTISTLTGFTVGAIYLIHANHSSASPPDQVRKFQYGSAEGDLKTTANGTGVAELNTDLLMVNSDGTNISRLQAFVNNLDATIGAVTVGSISKGNVTIQPFMQSMTAQAGCTTTSIITNQTEGVDFTGSSIGIVVSNQVKAVARITANTTGINATYTCTPLPSAPASGTTVAILMGAVGTFDTGGAQLAYHSSTERNAGADALLNRDLTVATDSGNRRSFWNAIRVLLNKWSLTAHANKLTVYKEDDTTEAYQKDVTTQTGTDGITQG